jgi:hypothetical protein
MDRQSVEVEGENAERDASFNLFSFTVGMLQLIIRITTEFMIGITSRAS